MNSLGEKISEERKRKGYTQEDLAEFSKINIRTIQRIEKDINEPRGDTLNRICSILEIDINELTSLNKRPKNISFFESILNFAFYLILNLSLITIIGYLTLDSNASYNSRIGAILLSFFIPIFIVFLTNFMSKIERILKFGLGYFLYIILLLTIQGIEEGFIIGFNSGLFFCSTIAVSTLYFGNSIFNPKNKTALQ